MQIYSFSPHLTVMDENSKDTVWWTSDEYKNDNHPASQEAWEAVKEIAKKELSDKRLFVVEHYSCLRVKT